eukprot:TRINITY_DN265_c0_g1_i5.p1 TRINITY_DN265_c0_g1~~TRINITY_DN265_c0_g1_i5.p1  ORF type:complete len:419 (+),score=89.44 TRINITY_DN265_c0_g1_i5:235-1491(+)
MKIGKSSDETCNREITVLTMAIESFQQMQVKFNDKFSLIDRKIEALNRRADGQVAELQRKQERQAEAFENFAHTNSMQFADLKQTMVNTFQEVTGSQNGMNQDAGAKRPFEYAKTNQQLKAKNFLKKKEEKTALLNDAVNNEVLLDLYLAKYDQLLEDDDTTTLCEDDIATTLCEDDDTEYDDDDTTTWCKVSYYGSNSQTMYFEKLAETRNSVVGSLIKDAVCVVTGKCVAISESGNDIIPTSAVDSLLQDEVSVSNIRSKMSAESCGGFFLQNQTANDISGSKVAHSSGFVQINDDRSFSVTNLLQDEACAVTGSHDASKAIQTDVYVECSCSHSGNESSQAEVVEVNADNATEYCKKLSVVADFSRFAKIIEKRNSAAASRLQDAAVTSLLQDEFCAVIGDRDTSKVQIAEKIVG